MGRTKTELVQTFEAIDESGNTWTLHVFQDFTDVTGLSDQTTQWAPTMKAIRTSNGDAVNRIQKGEYKVVHSGLQLTSDDPKAP